MGRRGARIDKVNGFEGFEGFEASEEVMMKWSLAAGLLVAVLLPVGAQSRIGPDINAKIRQEEKMRSEIMRTLHYLTDVYGP